MGGMVIGVVIGVIGVIRVIADLVCDDGEDVAGGVLKETR